MENNMSLIQNQIDVLTKSRLPGAVVYRAERDDARRYSDNVAGFEKCETKPDRWNFFKYDYRVVVPTPLPWDTINILSASLHDLSTTADRDNSTLAARQIIGQLNGLITA